MSARRVTWGRTAGNDSDPALEPILDVQRYPQTDEEVVVIARGETPLGIATAHAFTRSGSRVAVLSAAPTHLAAPEVIQQREGISVLPVGSAGPRCFELAAERIEDTLGPIALWINNPPVALEEGHAGREYGFELAYLDYVYASMAVLGRMLARDRGVLVQVSSPRVPVGTRAFIEGQDEEDVRDAVQGFTASLTSELSQQGSRVRVQLVRLGEESCPCETHVPAAPDVAAGYGYCEREASEAEKIFQTYLREISY